jgi:hypothetical protein
MLFPDKLIDQPIFARFYHLYFRILIFICDIAAFFLCPHGTQFNCRRTAVPAGQFRRYDSGGDAYKSLTAGGRADARADL